MSRDLAPSQANFEARDLAKVANLYSHHLLEIHAAASRLELTVLFNKPPALVIRMVDRALQDGNFRQEIWKDIIPLTQTLINCLLRGDDIRKLATDGEIVGKIIDKALSVEDEVSRTAAIAS